MLIISAVEYSKNPVNTGEALLIKVTVSEIMAYWSDLNNIKIWSDLSTITWDKVERKIF